MSTILDERPLSIRILSLAIGLPGLVGVFFVVNFFSVPSMEHGWFLTAAIVVPFVFAVLGAVGIGRDWRATAAVALTLSLLLGTWAYRTAPPVPERLAAVAAEVGTPSGWRTIHSSAGGSTWGLFGDYPRFDATHATSAPAGEAAAQYVALLEADGWEHDTQQLAGPPTDDAIRQTWRRDRWRLTFTIEPPAPERLGWEDEIGAGDARIHIEVGY